MEIFFGFSNSEFINDNTFSLKDKKKKRYRDFNVILLHEKQREETIQDNNARWEGIQHKLLKLAATAFQNLLPPYKTAVSLEENGQLNGKKVSGYQCLKIRTLI